MTQSQTNQQLGNGPPNAKVMYVGEAWGRTERAQKRGFVGETGRELRRFARLAGLPLETAYVTNVLNFQPEKNNVSLHIRPSEQYFSPEAITEVERLRQEIEKVNPNIIIAIGGISAYVLTNVLLPRSSGLTHPISSTRGSIYPCHLTDGQHDVLVTLHPSVFSRGDYRAGHYITLDLAKARERTNSGRSKIARVERNYYLEPTFEQVADYIVECADRKLHAFDIELRGHQVDCISLSFEPESAICIPFAKDNSHYWTLEEETEIWQGLASLLEDPEVASIAHNSSFDASFLYKVYGIRAANVHDTMLMTLLHYPDFNIGLDFITSLYSDIAYYKDDGKFRTKNFDKVLVEETTFDRQFWLYNAKDSIVLLDCFPRLKADLERQGNWQTYERARKLYPIMTWLTEKGVLMDQEGLRKASLEADSDLLKLTLEIRSMTGLPDVNPSSNQQLMDYFYGPKHEGGLGIKPYVNRSTGNPTIDKKARLRLAIKGYDVAEKLVEYSQKEKLKGSFLDIGLEDSRLKCSIFFARTGRFRTWQTVFETGGNMQNQPPVMKSYMIPDPGCILYNGDLGQAENRIVAYVAEDPAMMHAFEEGLDIHSYTASLILGKTYEEVSREEGSHPFLDSRSERDLGKQANHAFNYGMGPDKAALEWMTAAKHAREVHRKYHRVYKNVKRWHRLIEQQLNKTKTLTNLYGRKYTFWDRWGTDLFLKANAFTAQSTVADHINEKGLLFLWDNQELFADVSILNQVHDSILLQIPISAGWDYHEAVLTALRASLEEPLTTPTGLSFSIPFDLEMAWPNAAAKSKLKDLSASALEKAFTKLKADAKTP